MQGGVQISSGSCLQSASNAFLPEVPLHERSEHRRAPNPREDARVSEAHSLARARTDARHSPGSSRKRAVEPPVLGRSPAGLGRSPGDLRRAMGRSPPAETREFEMLGDRRRARSFQGSAASR